MPAWYNSSPTLITPLRVARQSEKIQRTEHAETKLQVFSFKSKIAEICLKPRLWFGYTQKIRWQITTKGRKIRTVPQRRLRTRNLPDPTREVDLPFVLTANCGWSAQASSTNPTDKADPDPAHGTAFTHWRGWNGTKLTVIPRVDTPLIEPVKTTTIPTLPTSPWVMAVEATIPSER